MAPANEGASADGEILGTGVGAKKAFLTDRRAFAVFCHLGQMGHWAKSDSPGKRCAFLYAEHLKRRKMLIVEHHLQTRLGPWESAVTRPRRKGVLS
jgi:hypothetical protein